MIWAAEEFKDIDLGDRRLDKRTVLLAERMAAKPLASIPQACGGWAERLVPPCLRLPTLVAKCEPSRSRPSTMTSS